jgi:hypothetical protein
MSWMLELRPVRLFELYLMFFFFLNLYLRIRQYRTVVGLVLSVQGRWPRLFKLVQGHGNLFLTWGTVLPGLLTLGLLLLHTLAYRVIWPQADLPLGKFLEVWPLLPVAAVSGVAMVGVDLWLCRMVAEIDRKMLEGYFDQAEYWLRSWTAPVVHVLSLGYINPRRIVSQEVRKALESVSLLLNSSLWLVSLQTGLRIAFGLSLWLAWIVAPWLGGLVYGGVILAAIVLSTVLVRPIE